MITPKDAGRGAAGAPGRIKRPDLGEARSGKPLRSRTATRPKAPADPPISQEVADAVKRGYDIITENIRQGREAAERFREGEYSLRQTPDELARLATRMMLLAREMSTTTFDVCDRVLRELGGAISAAKDRDGSVPPFRPAGYSASQSPEGGRLRLTPRCEGHPRAFGRPTTIDRPKGPTEPQRLKVGKLTSLAGGDSPIKAADVRFEVDLSREGVIPVVKTPPDHPAGVFSGMVYAGDDPSPLGAITIEVLK
jgi:hypothetical protein